MRLKGFTKLNAGGIAMTEPVVKEATEKALAIAVTLPEDGSPVPQFVPGPVGSVMVHLWPKGV